MERTTFLKNYRIRLQYDGTPYEPASAGSETSYEAVDERTGEPVSVMLIPIESIDSADRERFEEQVSAGQKLRHVNIAKVLDFGREADDYVYVCERLAGETLGSWVRSHGPMPADAALRVGEQIVSVLSSAGFHKLPYPPIQPCDIMLVPGQTAEGSWPLVKITNFGLPVIMAGPEPQPIESNVPDKAAGEQAVIDQQFSLPTTDIRSEIYSLGVTLYFLLTGVALSANALQRGPKFSGFPKPLRSLLGRLLHRDPDQRPKDLLVVTEMIRQSLGKIERRRALSDRYGIPLRTSVPRPREARPRNLARTVAVVGVLVLLAAAIAPVVFPDSIGKLVRDIQKPKQIGVLIGVPDSSPAASQPRTITQVPPNSSSKPPAVVSSQPVNPTALPETPAPANAAMTRNPFHVAPADVQQAQIASAQSQPAAPTNSAENSAAPTPDTAGSAAPDANASAQANTEQPPTTASQSSSQSRENSVASKSKRARAGRSSAAYSQQGRTRLMRSRVMGITSDGRLILRLPSGRTAVVAPDEEDVVPRHRNRVLMDRDQMFGPPPGSGSDYFPGD
ncbi:MAG: serine/threonine protein kinase [Chthoniobacterales bacterium]